jgi:hypothetical protein
MAYMLITLLHRRAKQKAAFDGSPRRLLTELAKVRCCRSIGMTGRKGRPRVHLQVEETDAELMSLAEYLGSCSHTPLTPQLAVYTKPSHYLPPSIGVTALSTLFFGNSR